MARIALIFSWWTYEGRIKIRKLCYKIISHCNIKNTRIAAHLQHQLLLGGEVGVELPLAEDVTDFSGQLEQVHGGWQRVRIENGEESLVPVLSKVGGILLLESPTFWGLNTCINLLLHKKGKPLVYVFSCVLASKMGGAKKEPVCGDCGKQFKTRQSLFKHKKNKVCKNKKPAKKTNQGKISCTFCDQKFSRVDNLKNHVRRVHSGEEEFVYLCGICPKYFHSKGNLKFHRMLHHSNRSRGGQRGFHLVRQAHLRACEIYKYVVPENIKQVDPAINAMLPSLRNLIAETLAVKRNMKAKLTMNVRFVKDTGEEEAPDLDDIEGVNVLTVPFVSSMKTMRRMAGLERMQVDEMVSQVNENLDTFNSNGSGWVIGDILSFDVQINECAPLQGACSSHEVEYRHKAGIVVEHGDPDPKKELLGERCFYRAVAKAILSEKANIQLTEKALEEFIANQICENVKTPVDVKDIDAFEDANSHLDIGINVLHKDDFSQDVFPCRATKKIAAKNMVNLMLFHTSPKNDKNQKEEEKDAEPPIMHYAWIRDICKLLGSTMRSKNGHMYKHKKELCYNCFNHFHNYDALIRHVQWCHQEKGQKKTLPLEGEEVFYQGTSKEIMIPHCFVFDFETLQKPAKKQCACPENKMHNCKHKTTVVTEQEPFAYSLVMVDRLGKVLEHLRYVGPNAAVHFVHEIVKMGDKYKSYVKDNFKPLVVTESVKAKFDAATECYLCLKPLVSGAAMDHDHMTGEYLGAAHNECNLHRAELSGKMVGFAHNFSGFDSHCVMKAIASMQSSSGDIFVNGTRLMLNAIPLNTEKFKIMKLNDITLMDSMSFVNDSLERLVDNLKASNHDFNLLRTWLGDDDDKLDLLTRKGVYPYEYMDSLDRLAETKLPPPKAFASKLSLLDSASPEDYAHAQKVWEAFDCQNLEDYTQLYCSLDCFLLLEILSELRSTLYNEFRLDMCHYFSLPMMAKEMLFKKTEARVELMTDIEMINMVRNNIRGGLSFVNQRHFDVEEESAKKREPVSMVYLDAVSSNISS